MLILIVQAMEVQCIETKCVYFIKYILPISHFLYCINQIVFKLWKSLAGTASSGSTAFI